MSYSDSFRGERGEVASAAGSWVAEEGGLEEERGLCKGRPKTARASPVSATLKVRVSLLYNPTNALAPVLPYGAGRARPAAEREEREPKALTYASPSSYTT